MTFNGASKEAVQDDLSQHMPKITLEKEVALSFGKGLLSLINIVTLNDATLSNLDGVSVAIYNVQGNAQFTDFDEISFTNTLMQQNEALHWEQIVRVREPDEQVWVFAGMNLGDNSLESVSVFVMENDTVTVINVDGELDKMLELALSKSRGHRRESRPAA